jgi:hypothetical protein
LCVVVKSGFDLAQRGADGSSTVGAMAGGASCPKHVGPGTKFRIRVFWQRDVAYTPGEQQTHERGDNECELASSISHCSNHTEGMGFDPTRQRQKSPFDYVFVGAAICVAIALVIWAILG